MYQCREGTRRLYELLDKITKGGGHLKLRRVKSSAYDIRDTSLWVLGQQPNPVLSTQ